MKHISVYAFSIENFNRSQEEVDNYFSLLLDKLLELTREGVYKVRGEAIQIRFIGNTAMIPEPVRGELMKVQEMTWAENSSKVLNMCIPYTSRDDIVSSIRATASKMSTGDMAKDDISEQVLSNNMYFGTNNLPLDILVRTSGHTRLSDFLLWQCNNNCKIEFVNTLWPNFGSLGVFLVLLNWSFQHQVKTERARIVFPPAKCEPLRCSVKALPPHPPFASVAD